MRHPKTEPGVRHGIFGVATIELIAGELGTIAKIFASRIAVGTTATGSTEPWNSDPLTQLKVDNLVAERRYIANNLVTWNEWEFGIRQFSINHVQISAANRTGAYLNQNLIRFRLGDRNIPENQEVDALIPKPSPSWRTV